MADFHQDPVAFVKELRVSKSVMKEMIESPKNWKNLMDAMVRFHRAWVIQEDTAVAVRVVEYGGATVSELELLVQFADKSQLFFSASDVWLRSKDLVVPYPEKEFLVQHQESRQNMINKFEKEYKRPWKDYMNESVVVSGSVLRNAEIEALEAGHAAATKTLEAGHEDATKTLKAVHEASTKTLEAGHEDATKTLKAVHEASTKTLEAGHEDATKTLEAGHATAIKTLKDLHEDVVSNLEAKCVDVQTKLKNLQEKMRKEHAFDRLRNTHSAVEMGSRVRHQTESFCSLPGRAGVPPPKERRDGAAGESSTKHPRP